MQSPGKFLTIFLLTLTPLMAALEVFTDAKKVIMGDAVTLTVRASGSDVSKPQLRTLCGEKITSTSQGTNIQSVNGKFSKSYTFNYVFTPLKDCTIEPITLSIDGQKETSEAIDIRVVQMQVTKDSPFLLEMSSEKKSVYVGEPFKVTLLFKQKPNSDAVDSEFTGPELKNFWIKEEQQHRRFEEGEYSVTRLVYIMAAQKAGEQEIPPARMKIATRSGSRDAWGQWFQTLKWRSYFSNMLKMDVKPLPEGVGLIGDFAIEAAVDKREIEPNEAVNVTLSVRGSGNFEDIESQKPYISGVSVFEEKPVIEDSLENGEYKGVWKQKFALVSDGSFTLPSFTIRYFDPASQSVKSISTEPIPITVRGEVKAEEKPLVIERAAEAEDETAAGSEPLKISSEGEWLIVGGVLAGVLAGVMLALLPWKHLRRKRESQSKIRLKDHKAVLALLMRHRDDAEAAAMTQLLEENLYAGAANAIDKKALKQLVKRLETE